MGIHDALQHVRKLIGANGIVKDRRYWGKTIKVVKKRTGVKHWSRGRDGGRKAKPPGWRVSENGRLYFENRVNRSDRGKSRL